MNLQQYINAKYKGKSTWFIDETTTYENQSRILNVSGIRDYLDGKHEILKRKSFKYNGEDVQPRRIVNQVAKTILNFKTQYLLKNKVTLIGDESMVKEFNKVNKLGKYDDINVQILSQLLKFGEVSEYLYIDNSGRIKSKLISADNGIPVYNNYNEMIAFIEHYTFDGITYYNLYTGESVQEWSNEGGKTLTKLGERPSLSGLPVHYKTVNELSDRIGRSDLDDYIGILNNLEDLISKYTDSIYKFINPIAVVTGQQLTNTSIPSEIVGTGLTLDDGSTFSLVNGQLDSKSFDLVYKTLMQNLLDVSATPSVAFNKSDVSNLSSESIRMMFSLANVQAGVNETYLREGFSQRWEKVQRLLKYKGITVSDDEMISLDFNFQYDMPSNHKEILDNLKTQFDMGAISVESIVEISPYVTDKSREMSRLKGTEYDVHNSNDTVGTV
ncbi:MULTISPECIES: phage portal protein [Lysinibacillus]|uniref:phage portal protein n=1 Tax=Lysinibacillus TaxID=400634 RepID=UPI0021A60F25|nr:phage portal protein [Lysinibacillus capsici]MCT1538437.1 phage portal protein [Lysinibacillus capsici]MCT1569145.1 phage portal protein [Lysinibacillus capsici]MCT1646160.1 phage portal protein [Lysinibacillus capsici]MCT1725334.1 phage portal protein [Lysinibacillus capsici]MCT1784114.1 phage portal protein [Lysinibacillus capsici]